MNLHVLRCPNCGAQIDIEDGVNIFFCKYCGYKIILDGQSKEEVRAHVKIKSMEHDEHMLDKTHQHTIETMREKRKVQSKNNYILLALIVLFMGALWGLMFYENADVKRTENKLQTTVNDIMEDISEDNFVDAYIKAETLHWDSQYSKDEGQEKWDSIRTEIIKQIQKAEDASNK